MPAAFDILQDSNGDLPIEQNNFTIGFSDQQHLKDAFDSSPGWWKQYPQNGIGIVAFFKARVQPLKVIAKVKQQLTNDGYTLVNPVVTSDGDVMGITPNAVRL